MSLIRIPFGSNNELLVDLPSTALGSRTYFFFSLTPIKWYLLSNHSGTGRFHVTSGFATTIKNLLISATILLHVGVDGVSHLTDSADCSAYGALRGTRCFRQLGWRLFQAICNEDVKHFVDYCNSLLHTSFSFSSWNWVGKEPTQFRHPQMSYRGMQTALRMIASGVNSDASAPKTPIRVAGEKPETNATPLLSNLAGALPLAFKFQNTIFGTV